MPTYDIFSKRGRQPSNDPFVYDVLPQPLMIQVVHIWRDALGSEIQTRTSSQTAGASAWEFIEGAVIREWGTFQLYAQQRGEAGARSYICDMEKPVERKLDVIETAFRVINTAGREQRRAWEHCGASVLPDEAIDELNQRFREHGVGYEFAGNQSSGSIAPSCTRRS